MKNFFRFGMFLVLASAVLCGCALGVQSQRNRTSVIDYLYPDKDQPAIKEAVPKLALPMTVGIAFVPSQNYGDNTPQKPWYQRDIFNRSPSGYYLTELSEAEKMRLIEQVAKEFDGISFIDKIERIPTAYLTYQGGFDNLDQIRSMYGIDTIVLLSFDQLQNTDEGALSLTYWTIVGAYLVKGEKNDTNTMIDAAVIHIPSRQLLFRAPGVSKVKGSSTLVNLTEQMRADSKKGFDLATEELIVNLKAELDKFKEKVKASPEKYEVIDRPPASGGGASGGGGSLDAAFALMASLTGAGVFYALRR